MSELNTIPVFRCRYCGYPVELKHLSTAMPDPEGKILYELMRNIDKVVYCNSCKRKRNYYAAEGRINDFNAGRP
jgi:hypothetical protein